MKQAFNPFLPFDNCIPDGEPHVFGDRIYLYGSHDKPCGETFCELDYEVWSAPVNDLTDWSSHGTVYSAKQDPLYSEDKKYLFAPDCVRGNDGRYYLYYALAGWRGKGGYDGPISVAVSDRPEGPFEYYGCVHQADGTPFNDKVLFDPAVINDDGTIRLYFGTSYFLDEGLKFPTRSLYAFIEGKIFNRSPKSLKRGEMTGAWHVVLADDMLTVEGKPSRVVPNKTKGTKFEGHAFFEGASIRKFGDLYYFIYSSRNNHELCYATSKYPGHGFQYGGVIISNGDVGYHGSKKKVALTGNNHGSVEKVGDWYFVFYHRMTDKSTYSRQACAEEVKIKDDGSIKQVEMTSCSLNGAPLKAEGKYSASIACNLYKGKMPHAANWKIKKRVPYITKEDGHWCITDITGGTVIGYKYFDFNSSCCISLTLKGNFNGTVQLLTEREGSPLCQSHIKADAGYRKYEFPRTSLEGVHALYIKFMGRGSAEFSTLEFKK